MFRHLSLLPFTLTSCLSAFVPSCLFTTMPTLTIDNRPVQVPDGSTVLDAARALGIDIPALCYRKG